MSPASRNHADASDEVSLTHNQHLIWIGQQLHPDLPLYEVPYRYTICGRLDPVRFAAAFRELVRRNEVLRIIAADDRWTQPSVRSVRDVECHVVDVSSDPDPQSAADGIVNERLAGRFDAMRSLCDATLIKLSPDRWEFLLTIHHALTDAFAGRVILATLARFYEAETGGVSASEFPDDRRLIEPTEQAKNVDADREWFASRSIVSPVTRFYSQGTESDPTRQTRIVVPLSDDENRAFSELASTPPLRQITPALTAFNLFATTLLAWLGRLEPRRSCCIGATTHGRATPAMRQAIGLFMQLLPFRVDFDPQDTFESLSRKVAVESKGFLAHARPDVMTAESQRALDVALNVIDLSVDDFCGMPTTLEWLHNGFGDPQRRLTVSAHPLSGDRWELLFDCCNAAFSAADRKRAIAHFRQTLMAIHHSPRTLIREYQLLTPSERSFLVKHGGSTTEPDDIDLWSEFDRACRDAGDAIAVEGPTLQMTYTELRERALALSDQLDAAEFCNLVPLVCRRDENAVVAMLGVLASGRCFLIVDAENPAERAEALLSQSGASMMLDATAESIVVRTVASPNPSSCDLPRNACYVLFTSGSTGRPNGVVVGHDAIWNLLSAFESIAPLNRDCRCSWWTNIGFDVAMYEVFSALLFGRTLCIPNDSVRLSADAMLDWLNAQNIHGAYLPPFFLSTTDRFLKEDKTLRLRRLLVGVEPIPQLLLASIADQVPELNLINGYGPTETTVCATLHRIDPYDRSPGPASIGRPVTGNRILVVDALGNPVPPGISGELWIGGVGLAKGYLGDPELTRRRFVTAPKLDKDSVWYRSGDRVRMRDDGTLEFLGRMDDQVKLAGVRIEPAEITATVRQCDGVHDCVVIPHQRNGRVEKLVAVLEADGTIDLGSIRNHLRRRLIPSMVPSHWIVQSRLPRTTNGKIDRQSLDEIITQELSEKGSPSEAQGKRPQNAIEYTLAGIMREVLGESTLGIDDDFFHHGGSSLDAMQLTSRANELGISIAIQDVFRCRDAESLARLAGSPRPSKEAARETPAIAELSPGQRAIWYHNQTHPDSPAYHFQVAWKANGRLDAERVADSLVHVVRRHPALRTTISPHDGTPVPRIHLHLPPEFQVWHHTATTAEIVLDGKRPFDLSEAGPLRALLIQPPNQPDTLAITVHHIAADLQSIVQLMHDFAHRYQKGDGGHFPKREGGRFFGSGSRFTKYESPSPFWERLRGCDRMVALPFDFGPAVEESESGELFRFSLSEELSRDVRQSASSCGVSVGTFLMAAYAVLLHRYSTTEAFTIGVPVSLRDRIPADDDEIAYLIEALPFAYRIQHDLRFDAMLQRVHDDFGELLAHRHTSHQKLAERYGTLFNTMFVPQQSLAPLQLDEGLKMTPEVSDLGVAKFDLTWFVTDSQPEIECAVEFRTNRFERDTIDLMTRHWQTLLRRLASSPDELVGQVDFRTAADHEAIRALSGVQDERTQAELTQTTTSHSPNRATVCQWIQSHAAETPGAIAVVCGDQSLSYQQLVDRADDLAARLVAAGVERGSAVALCLPRSAELIVGILAILKAGGAYVPFDPNLPEERLRRLASRAGIKTAVASGTQLAPIFETVIDAAAPSGTASKSSASVSVAGRDASDPDSLAYVLHTSGSTGHPKGVEVTHRALLQSTLARESFYESTPQRFLMLSPVWFDSSIAGLFWTLCSGNTLVIPEDQQLQDVQAIADLIDRHRVTDTLLLPSLYGVLLAGLEASRLQSLTRVILAGESCSRSVVRRHFRVLPETRLFNEYGPTEASVWCTAAEMKPTDAVVSIGHGVETTPVCLLDPNGVEIPIGCVGEIHVGGSRLASGYRGDPESTAQKFIADPRPGMSVPLYRTGDLARMRRDGSLVYLGRIDDQFKVNGVRVEPAEIESALVEIDGVNDAAVMSIPRVHAGVADSADDLIATLEAMPPDEAHRWIDRAQGITSEESDPVVLQDENIRLTLEWKDQNFISTPRKRQRKWLLDQTLRETAADLSSLNEIAERMVAGSDQPHVPRELSQERLSEQEIMEDWQTPLMKAMADWATESHGDVLEIGFGRGVAATMIQENGVRSHTIVEMNPHSIQDHFVPWRNRYADRDIRLVAGRWQDHLDHLRTYDSVFFHAFPMNESEFVKYVVDSVTFAEHFFPVASRLLRPGGVFTYLTTEIDSLSRRHQRSLLDHFAEIQLRVQPLSIPAETKDAWWADSMVVVRAVK
ncbi:Plipastatin synthase subunit D [Stieleria maiorica]|uniref:Plipastatin synthase subunit D n=1 Tax=Stieleria maiorica TaxID=2795974 RepID=A0A5B9MMU6_9BACT|nr:non-ribosomal peptide synthetase [Stieleria maiorica]QEG01371.1 Plipastatin synthase subunit D [Stieleria maiorica]